MDHDELVRQIEAIRDGQGRTIVVLVDGDGITRNSQKITLDQLMEMDEDTEFLCLHTLKVNWPQVDEDPIVIKIQERFTRGQFVACDDPLSAQTLLRLRGLIKYKPIEVKGVTVVNNNKIQKHGIH